MGAERRTILSECFFGEKDLKLMEEIAERRHIEAALRESEELFHSLVDNMLDTSIGKLSAGVAHEILNPVNIISMRFQLLEAMDSLPEDVRKTLEIFKDRPHDQCDYDHGYRR
jgi:signal transduction histidine kinase